MPTTPFQRDEVGESLVFPGDFATRAVDGQVPKRHRGIGRTGKRIRDRSRYMLGIRRVGDVHARHRALVDSAGEE